MVGREEEKKGIPVMRGEGRVYFPLSEGAAELYQEGAAVTPCERRVGG